MKPESFKISVKAGLSARLGVIIDRIGLGEGEHRTDVDVRLAANACLRYLDLRRGSEGASLTSNSVFRLEHHASLDAFSFVEGGKNLPGSVLCLLQSHHDLRQAERH